MTEQSAFKHVYVLGAGFSRPMGGPLFDDLLTYAMTQRIKRKTNEIIAIDRPLEALITEMSQHYMDIKTRIGRVRLDIEGSAFEGSKMNVEEFLEHCDAAVRGKIPWFADEIFAVNSAKTVAIREEEDPNSQRLQLFKRALKVRIALETNAFLDDLHDHSERWNAYDRWFKTLGPSDTIITTNYDCLIETLAERNGNPYPISESCTTLPAFLSHQDESRTLPRLLKVHGSNNWHELNGSVVIQDPVSIQEFAGRNIVIGMPGIEKQTLADKALSDVWLRAKVAIQEANAISIVGYSLPETDNHLRMELLDSIASNARNLHAVNIVLGSPSDRGKRAEVIINQAVRRQRRLADEKLGIRKIPDEDIPPVNLLPVYSQDFLPEYRPTTKDDALDRLAFFRKGRSLM